MTSSLAAIAVDFEGGEIRFLWAEYRCTPMRLTAALSACGSGPGERVHHEQSGCHRHSPWIFEAVIHRWLKVPVAHRRAVEDERTDRSCQALECAAVREAIPLTFLRNVDAGAGVVIEQPDDVAAGVESEIRVVACAFVSEEEPPAIGNHLDELIGGDDPVQALLADGFVFYRHGESLPGHARAVELKVVLGYYSRQA